jgi:hypothetical protein
MKSATGNCNWLRLGGAHHEVPGTSIYGTAVRNMVLEGFSYKSYAMRRGQFMSEASKRMQARLKESLP